MTVENVSGNEIVNDQRSDGVSTGARHNTTVVITGWRFWAALFGLSGGQFVSFLSIFLASSFLTTEFEKKAVSGIWLGLVMGLVQGATAVTTCIVLGLVHIAPLKYLITIGQVFCGVAVVAFGFTGLIQGPTNFLAACLVIRFFHGASMSLSNISALIAVSRISPPEKLTTIMGVNEFCVTWGLALSPAFGGLLYDLGQYRTPFFACGILFALFAALTLLALPRNIVVSKKPIRDMLRDSGNVKILSFIFFVIGGFLGFFSGMIEPQLRQYNLTASSVGAIIFVTNGVAALTFPLLGYICDASGKDSMVVIASFIVGAIGIVLFGPLEGVPIPSYLWIVIISLVLCGISISGSSIGCYAQTRNKLGDICEHKETADMVACSVYVVWGNLGAFLSSVVAGVLIQEIGYRKLSTLLLGLQLLAIACELFLTWRAKSKRISKKEIM